MSTAESARGHPPEAAQLLEIRRKMCCSKEKDPVSVVGLLVPNFSTTREELLLKGCFRSKNVNFYSIEEHFVMPIISNTFGSHFVCNKQLNIGCAYPALMVASHLFS